MGKRSILFQSLKLECVNSECERFRKPTYRRFDSLKNFTCRLCDEELVKVKNKSRERSLEKAKEDYEKIIFNCHSYTVH